MTAKKGGAGSAESSGARSQLTSEQADKLAQNFTPSWDTPDDEVVAMRAPEPPPRPLDKEPLAATNQTLIGFAPVTVPPNALVQAVASIVVESPTESAPEIEPEQFADPPFVPAKAKASLATPPAPGSIRGVLEVKDPFAPSVSNRPPRLSNRPQKLDSSADDLPKHSNSGVFLVIAGLAVAAGLGLFLKFALSDEPAKAPPTSQATARPSMDVPPPVPVDPAVPTTKTGAATKKANEPTVESPPMGTRVETSVVAASPVSSSMPSLEPRVEAPPSRTHQAPGPAVPVAKDPPKPTAKSASGGIVHDNPF